MFNLFSCQSMTVPYNGQMMTNSAKGGGGKPNTDKADKGMTGCLPYADNG